MRLLFVTDNGFSSKGEDFYYSGANVQHYTIATEFFDEIVFVARTNSYDPSYNKISPRYKTYLIDSITSRKSPLKIIEN